MHFKVWKIDDTVRKFLCDFEIRLFVDRLFNRRAIKIYALRFSISPLRTGDTSPLLITPIIHATSGEFAERRLLPNKFHHARATYHK